MQTLADTLANAAVHAYAQGMEIDPPLRPLTPAMVQLVCMALAQAYAQAGNDNSPAPPFAMVDVLPGSVLTTQAQEIAWDAVVNMVELNA